MSTLRKDLKQSRDFESIEQETLLNMLRTAGHVAGPFDRMFKEHQLSQPLYNVLRILRGQQGEGLACSHIGDRMVTRVPDVTRLIDKLIKLGLASRERSATDRRVVLISITSRGQALLAKLDGPTTELHQTILGHMSARELKELNRLLVKARSNA
ncbi:MAG: MarR family transcriptional regulator [Candidatus Krumholzibacteria bacterium]|nr:MarR family transcriptional regulator [Candidatus Krumholzibacteria bacterium]